MKYLYKKKITFIYLGLKNNNPIKHFKAINNDFFQKYVNTYLKTILIVRLYYVFS